MGNPATMLQFPDANDTLTTSIERTYHASPPLADITIVGIESAPTGLSLTFGGRNVRLVMSCTVTRTACCALRIFAPDGAWEVERLAMQYVAQEPYMSKELLQP